LSGTIRALSKIHPRDRRSSSSKGSGSCSSPHSERRIEGDPVSGDGQHSRCPEYTGADVIHEPQGSLGRRACLYTMALPAGRFDQEDRSRPATGARGQCVGFKFQATGFRLQTLLFRCIPDLRLAASFSSRPGRRAKRPGSFYPSKISVSVVSITPIIVARMTSTARVTISLRMRTAKRTVSRRISSSA
jgi:hypothetical protein